MPTRRVRKPATVLRRRTRLARVHGRGSPILERGRRRARRGCPIVALLFRPRAWDRRLCECRSVGRPGRRKRPGNDSGSSALSANPAKTGACEVDWDTAAITLLDRLTRDEQLVEAAQRADLTAIDVPLGWPDAFIDAVVAHRDRTGWPPIDIAPPEDRIPLRYRTTTCSPAPAGPSPSACPAI